MAILKIFCSVLLLLELYEDHKLRPTKHVPYSARFAVFMLDNALFPRLKLHLCMKMEVDFSIIK